MYVKVMLLFCSSVLLIKTVLSQVEGDNYVTHMTEQQFNDLKGPDFCGALKSTIDTLKDACTKVAKREGLIPPDGNLNFTDGNPKCKPVKIQFYDSQGGKTKIIDSQLVGCEDEVQTFTIGRGQAAKDIIMYDCPQQVCEGNYNMPGVF